MLTASCNDADDFKINGYENLKSEFSDWCDSSKCIFCKIDNQNVLELFFDVNPLKLKEWLAKPSSKSLKNIILFQQDILLNLYQCNFQFNSKEKTPH